MIKIMGGKRFAVLLCAEDSDYVKKKYGGYFGVFLRMLAEEGEIWDMYRVACGEFPDDDEIETYDGFVITGSCNDAHGNDAWICELLKLLKKLDSMKKKVLGICFGHQIKHGTFILDISGLTFKMGFPVARMWTTCPEYFLSCPCTVRLGHLIKGPFLLVV